MVDYTLNDASRGFKWGNVSYGTPGGTVEYSFAASNLAGEAFAFTPLSAQMQKETREAFAAWSQVANIDFKEVADSQTTNTLGIRVGLAYIDGAEKTEGLTTRATYSNSAIKAAQIAIDSSEGWRIGADGRVYDSAGHPFYHDMLHEIGHSIGLNHYDGGPAIMNSATDTRLELQASDINGIKYIYGPRGPNLQAKVSVVDDGGRIFDTYPIKAGESRDILITVTNAGNLSSKIGDVNISLEGPNGSGSVYASTMVNSDVTLAPGASTQIVYKLKVPADAPRGLKQIAVTADATGKIAETSEADNKAYINIDVEVKNDGRSPDYVVENLIITNPNKIGNAVYLSPGQLFDYSYDISNIGASANRNPDKMTLYLSLDRKFNASSLSNGSFDPSSDYLFYNFGLSGSYPAHISYSARLPANLETGVYYFAAWYYPELENTDSDKTNNLAFKEIAVIKPDLNKDGLPLVDDVFYYAHNRDVLRAKVDSDAHYNEAGWREGRDPSSHFSTIGYLAANSDVAKAGINPLAHYDQNGWKEGRDPSAKFDNELYLARNGDVKAAGVDPLAHYLQNGLAEGRKAYEAVGRANDLDAHRGFDAEYYLLFNTDVARAALNSGGDTFVFAYQHYKNYGWQEGRDPNSIFDTKGYLAAYKDVASAKIDPLAHYDSYGFKEGRDPSADFDTKAYLAANADVKAAGFDPMLHYLQHGALEGRIATSDGFFG